MLLSETGVARPQTYAGIPLTAICPVCRGPARDRDGWAHLLEDMTVSAGGATLHDLRLASEIARQIIAECLVAEPALLDDLARALADHGLDLRTVLATEAGFWCALRFWDVSEAAKRIHVGPPIHATERQALSMFFHSMGPNHCRLG